MAELQHLPAFLPALVRAGMWFVILVTIFVPLEHFFAVHPQKILRKSVLGDLGFYVMNGLLPQVMLAAPLAAAAYVAYHYVPVRLHSVVYHWPIWLRGLAAFVVGDFGFYWGHRWSHQIPFLWRFHAVHHDPEHMYFLISSRAHPVDFVFTRLCGLIPIYLLGLGAPDSVRSALVPTVFMLVMTIWGFFIHSNIRWRFGPLEWLFATPGFHHWHHTLAEPRDRNFASMLPWMDWIFRTHYLPKEWPAAYGIENKLPPSMIGQLIQPIYEPSPPVVAEQAGANTR